ncbi:uncharacterized protein LOC142540810 isoform X2 [Primulina tabacum]|uniref:uncharacterized protein LOC142540810 isoform X2 n=1 Tax=Primulina tabacum TaxID=48773 RepID=UPI003F5A199B
MSASVESQQSVVLAACNFILLAASTMVRFPCFQSRVHSPKQKLPTEAMQRRLEDTSQNWVQKNLYCPAESKPFLKDEVETLRNGAKHANVSSPTDRDCRSEEMESKYSNEYNIEAHKNAQIKKSLSLGSGLYLKEWNSVGDVSEGEMEQRFTYNGSADSGRIVVSDDINDHVHDMSEQCQEPMAFDSVMNSDFTKKGSIFSIEDSLQSEREGADKYNLQPSVVGDTGDNTPHIPRAIVNSRSLPSMVSSTRRSTSLLPCSRSADELNALGSGMNNILVYDARKQVQNRQHDYSIFDNDKEDGESPADEDTCENYNYFGSAKDWIIPVSEGAYKEKSRKEESSLHRWDEVPSEDLRLKRTEKWVVDHQHCSPLKEESDEFYLFNGHELPKSDALAENPTGAKLEVKVNLGNEVAKRYISSMNASAATAKLTNLGLVVIPFLSPFISLKTLDLSGNSIVRLASGALPRGLQFLNLSKNSISAIEGLRDLTRLRVLDLSYNRLLRIGHGLASCSSMKELYLTGNKISEVEGLHRLLKLNVLDLRFNKISTTKCLGQLAANHICLQALSLEGNPAQKNVGDEQLKKYVQSLLPNLIYYNRQSIKTVAMKDIKTDRSARVVISGHQIDRVVRAEANTVRKGTHGIVSHKAPSSANHVVSFAKPLRAWHGRLPPTGIRATQRPQFAEHSSKHLDFIKNDLLIRRSRSEGNLGAP